VYTDRFVERKGKKLGTKQHPNLPVSASILTSHEEQMRSIRLSVHLFWFLGYFVMNYTCY